MAQDQITFGRATTAAVIGLVIQTVLTIGTGLVSIWAESPSIQVVTWHMLAGLPIWIILAIIFHQHKIERAEALETEQLSKRDREAAAMFDERADDLDLARRRLDRLYSWGLNVISALVAVYLVAMGGWMLFLSVVDPGEGIRRNPFIRPDMDSTELMGLTTGMFAVAFVAFISARWVSGYTKVKEWQLLRGGASYLMGSGAMALLIFAAALWSWFDSSNKVEVFLWTGRLATVIMMLVGVEILFTFLLGAYRPRRPGERPRPAFDSRMLGMLTSPESLGKIVSETINYQFGFEISRSWFYKLLGQKMPYLVVFAVGCLMLISCFTVVEPHQKGVILRMGDRNRIVGPGPSLKMPWPLETVQKYDVKRVQQLELTTDKTRKDKKKEELATAPILWVAQSEEQDKAEEFYVTAPTLDATSDGDTEGAGMSLAGTEVTVQYRVDDGPDGIGEEESNRIFEVYLDNGAYDDEQVMRAIAEQKVAAYFASHDIDNILGRDRFHAADIIRNAIQAESDRLKLGLRVVNVSVTGVRPPLGRVSNSFHNVVSADQDAQAAIEDAQKERISILAKAAGSVEYARQINTAIAELDGLRAELRAADDEAAQAELRKQVAEMEVTVENLVRDARGEAAEMLHKAIAYRWEREIGAQAQVVRSRAEYEPYQVAPAYYRTRRYYQTIAEGLKDRRKFIITSKQAAAPVIDIELKDDPSAIDTLFNTD